MKAGTLSPAKSLRPGSRVKPILFWSIAALVLLCVGLVLWFLSVAHSALPQLDGALAVRGLSAPVSVTRDGHGVPTIDALTMDDLFFAQGYVTAQDRLFQMDLLRRAAEGELSEIAGEGALKHDRQQRILGLRAAAEKGVLVATPDDHRQFQQYARGVNAYINSHRKNLPLEFRILHYSPKPWTEVDSLAIAYQMVETLSTSPKAALTREKVLAKLGPELTGDLYVNTSWRDHPPTASMPAANGAPPVQHVAETSAADRSDAVAGLLMPWLEPFFRD